MLYVCISMFLWGKKKRRVQKYQMKNGEKVISHSPFPISYFPFTNNQDPLRETLLAPLVLRSRITPVPLYSTSLAPLACADNSLFTVIFISLAPLALALHFSVII